MLRFEGNTAAFILYSYVRVAGIKRKAGVSNVEEIPFESFKISHPSEIGLALYVNQFGETLNQIVEDLLPHRLCEYLYHLAEKFNAFSVTAELRGRNIKTPDSSYARQRQKL